MRNEEVSSQAAGVFSCGVFWFETQTGTQTPPAYWPGFMLVPKGKTKPPPLAIPKRTQYKLEGVKLCHTYLLLSCQLHNLIRHKPNGWAAIKMVFTSPSYMLVTQYSALVEFKTWSGPGQTRICLLCGSGNWQALKHRGGTLMMLHGGSQVRLCFGKSSGRAKSDMKHCTSGQDLTGHGPGSMQNGEIADLNTETLTGSAPVSQFVAINKLTSI